VQITASPREKRASADSVTVPDRSISADAGSGDDPAGSGCGERVLVVDARICDAHHDLTLVEVVDSEFLEAGYDFSFRSRGCDKP